MKLDHAGFPIFTREEICDYLYEHPETSIDILQQIRYATVEYIGTIEDIDTTLQSKWNRITKIPDDEHPQLKYEILKAKLFGQCNYESEKQRVIDELTEFENRRLDKLLIYLDELVTLMKQNNIVWGVGRGSSVASYVLFLIGIHKIDSLKYDLDYHEFFK